MAGSVYNTLNGVFIETALMRAETALISDGNHEDLASSDLHLEDGLRLTAWLPAASPPGWAVGYAGAVLFMPILPATLSSSYDIGTSFSSCSIRTSYLDVLPGRLQEAVTQPRRQPVHRNQPSSFSM